MIMPILFYTIYFNFFNRAQMGIPFLLIIFPCILVFCGKSSPELEYFHPHGRKLAIGLKLSPHLLCHISSRLLPSLISLILMNLFMIEDMPIRSLLIRILIGGRAATI